MANIVKKIFNDQLFKYLVAGVGATIIYFIIKISVFNIFPNGVISEIVAQTVAIIFAFVTNKLLVFEKTTNPLAQEFFKFVISRLLVLLLSVIANWYLVDTHPTLLINMLHLPLKQSVIVLSLFLQVLTIFLNYIFSKFLIFTTK